MCGCDENLIHLVLRLSFLCPQFCSADTCDTCEARSNLGVNPEYSVSLTARTRHVMVYSFLRRSELSRCCQTSLHTPCCHHHVISCVSWSQWPLSEVNLLRMARPGSGERVTSDMEHGDNDQCLLLGIIPSTAPEPPH